MKTCSTEQEYISAIAPAVQRACKRYGYLPSILIAQSCLENGYGIESYWDNTQIALLLKANNMVGIKTSLLSSSWSDYTVWQGESITKQTPEEYDGKMVTITDDFRVYDTPERSFCDFLLFLTYASNYGKGGTPKYGQSVLSIKDPETLIKKVSSLGYATGSTYPTSVMRIVSKHGLTKYDDLTGIEPTEIVPEALSKEDKTDAELEETMSGTVKKLADRAINDITQRNLSQTHSRGSNAINYIVVHYLGVPNADNPDLYDGGYGGHYNITRKGLIYKAADPKTAAVWHCGGGLQGSGGHAYYGKCTNHNSIGIENGVCYTENVKKGDGDSNKWYFTEEAQESLVWLVSKLMDEYGIPITRVIRHYDVTGKICPNPYVKNNGLKTSWTWDEFKTNLAQYRKDGTITIPTRSSASGTFTVLAKGSTGDDVRTLQTMLNACGYSCGTVDGIFGGKTYAALVAMQKANKLTASGQYDKNTSEVLKALYIVAQSGKTASKTTTGTTYNGVDYSPVFNASYYSKKYADLKAAFGTDKAKLFEHFCVYGMKEGRQASATFNVQKYKARYADLRKAFGGSLPEYYKHYCVYGKNENRKAT